MVQRSFSLSSEVKYGSPMYLSSMTDSSRSRDVSFDRKFRRSYMKTCSLHQSNLSSCSCGIVRRMGLLDWHGVGGASEAIVAGVVPGIESLRLGDMIYYEVRILYLPIGSDYV